MLEMGCISCINCFPEDVENYDGNMAANEVAGVFSGNLSLDVTEGTKWNISRSGLCGMRSKKIYTENWVNSPGQMEDNSWQAFVCVPKDNWLLQRSKGQCHFYRVVERHFLDLRKKYGNVLAIDLVNTVYIFLGHDEFGAFNA